MTHRSGQTLVLLLVFFAVAITITTAAVATIVINTQSSSDQEVGLLAYQIAESGAEDALIRLIRNPNFTSPGYTLTVGPDEATITVSGVATKTVTATGVSGNFSRIIQVTAVNSSGLIQVTDWSEIYP
jgi:hypothetical protein